MPEEIKAMFIFEILGKPPKHIKKTLSELVDKLGELEGIKISNKKIHEPKPAEEQAEEKQVAGNLFTTFAEVEILGKDLNAVLNIVLHALPSHIEIIEPRELSFKNYDLSSTLSILATKLHKYDEIAKISTIEKNILINKLKEVQEKLDGLEKGIKSGIKKKGEKAGKKIEKKAKERERNNSK